jgi:hypothetical protein
MKRHEPTVIDSYAVRTFIKMGGTLRFVAVGEGGGRVSYTVMAVTPGGEELPIVLPKTGKPRVFRSADAAVAYHASHFPEATSITLPHHPRSETDRDVDAEFEAN